VPENKNKHATSEPHLFKDERRYTSSEDDLPLCLHPVLLPTRHKLDCLGESGRFTVLRVGLGLEQNPGGFGAGEHDKVFSIGIWLEISREGRGPSSRSRVNCSGGGEEAGGVASFLRYKVQVRVTFISLLPSHFIGAGRDLRGSNSS